MTDLLQIADLRFTIDSAKLDAFVSEAGPQRPKAILHWGFRVEASRTEEPHSDWTPVLKSEILFETGPGELSAWTDVAPRTITWTTPFTPNNDPYSSLYVFEHAAMEQGQAGLSVDQGVVRLRLEGTCNVCWDEKYGEGLKLILDTAVDFAGILCARDSEEVARRHAESLLDGAGLRFFRDEYGVSSLRPR